MNYITPHILLDVGIDMARKSPQQLMELGQAAADLALSRIPAIEASVPDHFTPAQRRRYIATLQLFEQPGAGSQQKLRADTAERQPRRGLSRLFCGA